MTIREDINTRLLGQSKYYDTTCVSRVSPHNWELNCNHRNVHRFRVYNTIIEGKVWNTYGLILQIIDKYDFHNTSCILTLDDNEKCKVLSVGLSNSVTRKWIQTNILTYKIKSIQSEDNVENILDYIFSEFYKLLINKNYDLINDFMEKIEIEELSIDTIVGVLTITSNWKKELISRNSFYQRAYSFVNELYLTDETNQIFVGLE